MFLHAELTLYLNLKDEGRKDEREGLCLQTLRMPVNIYFSLPCWDDAITLKTCLGETSPYLQKRDLGCEKHSAYLGRDNFYM